MQKLLLLVGGLVGALFPKLYRLWQGLVDSERTARPVLPHPTAAATVEVVIVHFSLDVLVTLR